MSRDLRCVRPEGNGMCGAKATHYRPFTGPHSVALNASVPMERRTVWCAAHVTADGPAHRAEWAPIGK